MRTHFDKQLNKLNDELIEMGSMIEKAIEHTIKALVTQDIDLAKYVIDSDEQINRQERDIESLCLKLLLQQQPVARDLRQISSALKMITDMERIRDHASDISEIIVTLLKREEPYIKHLDHIQSMAKETSVMLVGSVDAFVNRNQLQAAAVIEKDDVVDDLFRKVQYNAEYHKSSGLHLIIFLLIYLTLLVFHLTLFQTFLYFVLSYLF